MSKKKEKSINLNFDISRPLERVLLMNALAEMCRVLHEDREVGKLSINIVDGAKGSKKAYAFDFKIV